jgi:hypothetical protein
MEGARAKADELLGQLLALHANVKTDPRSDVALLPRRQRNPKLVHRRKPYRVRSSQTLTRGLDRLPSPPVTQAV